MDEHTEIYVLPLKKFNNYENAEVLVPELTDEESKIISAKDLLDLPPMLILWTRKTLTLQHYMMHGILSVGHAEWILKEKNDMMW